MHKQNILFGDIGGTNARVATGYFNDQSQLVIDHIDIFKNKDFSSFNDILSTFKQIHQIDYQKIKHTCFAVAAPIKDGEAKFTNINWELSEKEIQSHLKCTNVTLLNDFTATGFGIHLLSSDNLFVFNDIKASVNTEFKTILGAGTGLGVTHISYDNGKPVVHPSEGGHIDFAPVGAEQIKLLEFLNTKLKRVSVERILSGYGLLNVYEFLKTHHYKDHQAFQSLDDNIDCNCASSAKYIYEQHQNYPIAKHCIDIFMQVYAQTISNYALATLPFGGLYVAGGIAPQLKNHFTNEDFKQRLFNKGRMSNLITDIPMYIILDTNTGLKGAGYYAHLMMHAQKNPA